RAIGGPASDVAASESEENLGGRNRLRGCKRDRRRAAVQSCAAGQPVFSGPALDSAEGWYLHAAESATRAGDCALDRGQYCGATRRFDGVAHQTRSRGQGFRSPVTGTWRDAGSHRRAAVRGAGGVGLRGVEGAAIGDRRFLQVADLKARCSRTLREFVVLSI